MRAFARIVFLATVVFSTTICALALPQSKEAKKPAGSIAGRVTFDGKPARNVTLTLLPARPGPRYQPAGKATTAQPMKKATSNLPA
jgi:hypothetical protein